MGGSLPVQPWGCPPTRSALPVPCLPVDIRGVVSLHCVVLVPRTKCSQIVAGIMEEECGCHGACQGDLAQLWPAQMTKSKRGS